jgi:hypothetical protein
MTTTPKKFLKPDEKPAKVIRYNGDVPADLSVHLSDGDAEVLKDSKQAVFEIQGFGTFLMESTDGEHWKPVAMLVEDKSGVTEPTIIDAEITPVTEVDEGQNKGQN